MRHADTIDKVVEIYLAGLCREEFSYRRKLFRPKTVIISPLVTRGFTCPALCGACCGSFSLDWLPTETRPDIAGRRAVELNGRAVVLLSDMQKEVGDRWCRHLNRNTARCGIYDKRPFACDFELIRFLVFDEKVIVTQKLYGRAWAMTRLNGDKGTACAMLPADPLTTQEVIRKFQRLLGWSDYFGIRTCVPSILEWLKAGNCNKPLRLAV